MYLLDFFLHLKKKPMEATFNDYFLYSKPHVSYLAKYWLTFLCNEFMGLSFFKLENFSL